jgi:hypothetical protein
VYAYCLLTHTYYPPTHLPTIYTTTPPPLPTHLFRHLNQGLIESIDYADTFIDAQHALQAFTQLGFTVRFQENACSEYAAGSELGGANPNSGGERVITAAEGATADVSDLPGPPYRVLVVPPPMHMHTPTSAVSKKSKGAKGAAQHSQTQSQSSSLCNAAPVTVMVIPYRRANPGPYPEDRSPTNTIRFTPTQVAAIRSGCNPGLTMVVGPPGTGKTDVAVQIIVNLYRNHPTQKILVVTHSNAALNDLFEKIMEREVAPRHLLRLGAGELELRDSLSMGGALGGGKGQGEAFSKQGRVNWSLSRRLQLLAQVQRLGASLGVAGDSGSTCETAAYFRLQHVQARVEKFRIEVAAAQVQVQAQAQALASAAASASAAGAEGAGGSGKKAKGGKGGKAKAAETAPAALPATVPATVAVTVSDLFPFTSFFADTPSPLFSPPTATTASSADLSDLMGGWAADLHAAEGCFLHLQTVFEELADYRAFELLRSQSLRADFLLTKQVGSRYYYFYFYYLLLLLLLLFTRVERQVLLCLLLCSCYSSCCVRVLLCYCAGAGLHMKRTPLTPLV